MHILGLEGMPRRTYTYPDGMGWNLWNIVSTIGAFTIAVSIAIFFVNAIITARKGREAGADPWDGRTLEWSLPSPAPEYNFAEVPMQEPFRPGRLAWSERRQGFREEGRRPHKNPAR